MREKLTRKAPLIAIVLVSVIAGVLVIAQSGWLKFDLIPFDQETHSESSTITIVESPEYMIVTVEISGSGENDTGIMYEDEEYTVTSTFTHNRVHYKMEDTYDLVVRDMSDVLIDSIDAGTLTDTRSNEPEIKITTWTPTYTGDYYLEMNIQNMVWTELFWISGSDIETPAGEFNLVSDNSDLVDHDVGEAFSIQWDLTYVDTDWLYEFDWELAISDDEGVTYSTLATGHEDVDETYGGTFDAGLGVAGDTYLANGDSYILHTGATSSVNGEHIIKLVIDGFIYVPT